jgi:hypothetical protein
MRASRQNQRFTRREAEALVGRRVRSLADYAYLPTGTTGCVVAFEEVGPEEFELVVEWDGSRRVALRDWFTHTEFDRFLTEA